MGKDLAIVKVPKRKLNISYKKSYTNNYIPRKVQVRNTTVRNLSRTPEPHHIWLKMKII